MKPINNKSTVYIQDTPFGKGMFSQTIFKKDDLVISGKIIQIESVRSKYSIEIDHNKHAIADLPLIYVNHSCEPNVYVKCNHDMIYFIAYTSIKPNDQIFFDYETTESRAC